MLEAALAKVRGLSPQWVVAIGGGAVLDMGKALAGLINAHGPALGYLEIVGQGLILPGPTVPFIALPTTAGTGAEASKNAVIGLPDHGCKVSLRHDEMLARLVIVDPALTDGCPRTITLASGMDAVCQVVESFVSNRATPFTDALARPAIGAGLSALQRLMQCEDPDARDQLAWVSLSSGMALANGGLGAVHGLAGPIGGVCGAAHGAICGALLSPVLALNRGRATGQAAARLEDVCQIIADALGCTTQDAPQSLATWGKGVGLSSLIELGLDPALHNQIADAALTSSSMKGNPVTLTKADALTLLQLA
jgi:alcohol dehydrogenase class IV